MKYWIPFVVILALAGGFAIYYYSGDTKEPVTSEVELFLDPPSLYLVQSRSTNRMFCAVTCNLPVHSQVGGPAEYDSAADGTHYYLYNFVKPPEESAELATEVRNLQTIYDFNPEPGEGRDSVVWYPYVYVGSAISPQGTRVSSTRINELDKTILTYQCRPMIIYVNSDNTDYYWASCVVDFDSGVQPGTPVVKEAGGNKIVTIPTISSNSTERISYTVDFLASTKDEFSRIEVTGHEDRGADFDYSKPLIQAVAGGTSLPNGH